MVSNVQIGLIIFFKLLLILLPQMVAVFVRCLIPPCEPSFDVWILKYQYCFHQWCTTPDAGNVHMKLKNWHRGLGEKLMSVSSAKNYGNHSTGSKIQSQGVFIGNPCSVIITSSIYLRFTVSSVAELVVGCKNVGPTQKLTYLSSWMVPIISHNTTLPRVYSYDFPSLTGMCISSLESWYLLKYRARWNNVTLEFGSDLSTDFVGFLDKRIKVELRCERSKRILFDWSIVVSNKPRIAAIFNYTI